MFCSAWYGRGRDGVSRSSSRCVRSPSAPFLLVLCGGVGREAFRCTARSLGARKGQRGRRTVAADCANGVVSHAHTLRPAQLGS